MQRSKTLTRVFRQLADLCESEAERNAAFAEKLDAILAPLPKAAARGLRKPALEAKDVPDAYAKYLGLGEDEFRFWLRSLDLLTLKAIVRLNGFDPSNLSRKWSDGSKFVTLITDQVKARLRRGSGFMTPPESPPQAPPGDAN